MAYNLFIWMVKEKVLLYKYQMNVFQWSRETLSCSSISMVSCFTCCLWSSKYEIPLLKVLQLHCRLRSSRNSSGEIMGEKFQPQKPLPWKQNACIWMLKKMRKIDKNSGYGKIRHFFTKIRHFFTFFSLSFFVIFSFFWKKNEKINLIPSFCNTFSSQAHCVAKVCVQILKPSREVLLDLLWDFCGLISVQVSTHLWHVSISPHVLQTALERAKVVVHHV